MRLRDRMLGITFQWNRGAGGFTTPEHAKQHGKHGLNFSFSLSVFCDNFGEDNGPNNHIISPNPYSLDGALGKDRDYGMKLSKLLREEPKPTTTPPLRRRKPGVNERRKSNDWRLGRASQAIHRLGSAGLAYDIHPYGSTEIIG